MNFLDFEDVKNIKSLNLKPSNKMAENGFS